MVFYRKYRPQTIEELDSKAVRDALTAVLSAKSISHAFLFTGPKGLGKTSTARIVAKAVNCLARQKINKELRTKNKEQKEKIVLSSVFKVPSVEDIEPCNKCYQCISITNGSNIDVLEIDGASNRGIDEIRDLREKVRLAPAAAFKKVYIIDEVHMLTQEAFNALLKTLEEPPSHVIFILCTTEPHKVPATIVSRCFHITFKKATIDELVRSFKRIVEKEKLKIYDETLKFIGTLSDGSFRDGVKILEEMVTYGKTITKELVEEKYQISNIKYQISELIEILSKRDAKEGLQLISKLIDQGVDIKYFTEQLINTLHGFLLYKVAVESKEEFSIFNFQFSIEEIKELVELLLRSYGKLKYAVLPQLPLELAIIEWSQQSRINADQNGDQRRVKIQHNSAFRSAAISDKTKKVKEENGSTKMWQELIDKVKVYNHSIAGVLRGCGLKSYDNKKIVIETGYKFHKERLDEKKTMEILKKVCKEISGKTIGVSVLLKEQK